jgi:hypothetical protein
MHRLRWAAMATLSSFARKMLLDSVAFRDRLTHPVLLWQYPIKTVYDLAKLGTATGRPSSMARPEPGEPLVFELKKTNRNSFTLGLTVGHADNNDIVIDDPSVSRFHAHFQRDAGTGVWKVVDAGSKNGTWVGDARLVPSRPSPVSNRVRIRFGEVDVVFYEPASFFEYLEWQVRED